uniref:Uncharacterized protein n=1 Tax=Nelumbo nucifera TaxID=4432 RepID=A0A822Z6I7_NELNU|nr:TPA_asm: hypothetical protein HUJ06_014506 [Nelumbo nucifera]
MDCNIYSIMTVVFVVTVLVATVTNWWNRLLGKLLWLKSSKIIVRVSLEIMRYFRNHFELFHSDVA